MFKPLAFANAATIIFAVAYTICGVTAFIAPNLLLGIAGSWFHSINLEVVRASRPMPFGSFIFGIITFSGYVWILTYATASLYNKLAK